MEEIRYDSKELERLCHDERYAKGKLNVQGMKKLRRRMEDLEAAPTLAELPPVGRPHPLDRDLADHYAIDLDGGRRLVFKAIDPAPRDDRGRIDWPQVSRIIITHIEDYHDG